MRLPSSEFATTCARTASNKHEQGYAEGSSLDGVFYEDIVRLGDDDGEMDSFVSLTYEFGCHTSENGLFTTQMADGIMGLSRGSLFCDILWKFL